MIMQTPIISVIIPIYNAEKYLNNAIDSVLDQSEKDVELILVDDGSTDNSGSICDNYIDRNLNIKVIHKKNGGISSARNAGLIVAKGVYVSFLDADDWVAPNTYESIINVLKQNEPDCVDFGLQYVRQNGEISYTWHALPKNVILNESYIAKTIIPSLLGLVDDKEHFIFEYSCNKIFKMDIIREKKIFFDETRRVWEDKPFLLEYLKYCKTYYSIEKLFYNYRDTPGSLSRRFNMQFFDIIFKNYNLYVEWYGEKYDFNTEYVNTCWCQSIESMVIRSLKQTSNKRRIKESIIKALENEHTKSWYRNRKCENKEEKLISRFVAEGNIEKAIKYYEKRVKKENSMERLRKVKIVLSKVKQIILNKD